jgi:hypothetical protein
MFIAAKLFFWILGIMFFVGAFGSALVVIMTSIHDVKDLREREEPAPANINSSMTPVKTTEWA